jgi:UDPglucose 6-dehydrogenase
MIGFVGLSHLGLNYSLATAAKGFDVVAYDPDTELVRRLQAGEFPIEEPGFRELHERHHSKLRYTSDAADLASCNLVFYSLDVRTNAGNESDFGPLTALIQNTDPSLASTATAVVLSQVRPGYTRELAARLGTHAGRWYYQVETLIFGSAVQRAMEPERYIVGAPRTEVPLPEAYAAWARAFGCPVLVMRYESAELAKIAINFFLVSSVSTTNTLAGICEAIGADWAEIAPALRLDKRIGPHAYLKPGLGIAGGNLERDLVTVQGLASGYGVEAGIVDAWQRSSAHSRFWALRVLERELLAARPTSRIAVWGLAYKQDTHSIRNSASVELIRTISGCDIHAYDPAAHVESALFSNLTVHASALEALAGADALAVMTPWKEFSAIAPSEIRRVMKGKLVVDPYCVLDRGGCASLGIELYQMGSPAPGKVPARDGKRSP